MHIERKMVPKSSWKSTSQITIREKITSFKQIVVYLSKYSNKEENHEVGIHQIGNENVGLTCIYTYIIGTLLDTKQQ